MDEAALNNLALKDLGAFRFVVFMSEHGFSDINMDFVRISNYFRDIHDSDIRRPLKHVGSMTIGDSAMLVSLEVTDDDEKSGFRLELLTPTDESDEHKCYLSSDKEHKKPYFRDGAYKIFNIYDCVDYQDLALLITDAAKEWHITQSDRLDKLRDTIELDVMSVKTRLQQGHEFPANHAGTAFIASDGITGDEHTFGLFPDEPSKIGIKNVQIKMRNGIEWTCDLLYNTDKNKFQAWPHPESYSPDGKPLYPYFWEQESAGVNLKQFLKPTDETIKRFCDEFETFHEEWEKFNEAIIEKEHRRQDDTALTLTAEGRAKIADYHRYLTLEDVIPHLKKFYLDVYPKQLEKEGIGSNYYVDGNMLTLNFDPENPLVLEFKKDFVKTRVLDVMKEPDWVDEPEVRISYQQGNKVGTMYMPKQEYESLAGFYEAETIQQTVGSMMSCGKLAYIPDLKEQPLIEDQSFILQEIYRRSLSDPQGMVFIDEKNCGEFLSDEQKSVLEPEEYAYAVKERLRQEKYDNPLLADEFQFHEFVDNEPFVTVFAHFPEEFAHEAMDAKEMLLAADTVLMDLAKEESRGEKTGLTFEKALEKRGIDKEDFMEQVKKAGRSREVIEGASIADGAIRLESQQDRKDAAKVLSGWMKKPGEKIAKEIKALKAREDEGR